MRIVLKRRNIIIFSIMTVCISSVISISSTRDNTNYERSFGPLIETIEPTVGAVGETLTITGSGFGIERGETEIFIGAARCQDYDFNYVSWSNSKIIVTVPTGAETGPVSISAGGEFFDGPLFSTYVPKSHFYSSPRDITIDYSLYVNAIETIQDNPLYIWVPGAVPSDNQKNISTSTDSGNLVKILDDGLHLFRLDHLQAGKTYRIAKQFSMKNYRVHTIIDPEWVSEEYDFDSEFYEYYTAGHYAVEADNPRMINLARNITGEEDNPYRKARLIYDWVIDFMTYQYPPPGRDWKAISALSTGRGDCAVYSFLFTALCRASGVPARPVAGHVLFLNDHVSMHYWAEFFLPQFGWIPVDANYGDQNVAGMLPREMYFGNLDNRHIAFSKGRVDCMMPGNDGTGKSQIFRYVQKYYARTKNRIDSKAWKITRDIKRVL
jgi:transglutaminase-like putative cysteine protease